MVTAIQNASERASRSNAEVIASQAFANVFRAYMECSDAIQEAIRDMVEIVNDSESTKEETDAALLTIVEALFPSHQNGSLGGDLEECEETAPEGIRAPIEEADADEAEFAKRVGSLLEAKSMTQSELANAIGVGQSAISMMLSRNCRPQRRTIEKIAKALKVDESEIWPAQKKTQT